MRLQRNPLWVVQLLASAVLLAACSPQNDQAGSSSNDGLWIENLTIVDVHSGDLLEDAAIRVAGNHITWVGSRDSRPEDGVTRVFDARGAFAIPGLWDMHTHALWEPFASDGSMDLFLVNGVTGIRDMGGTLATVRAIRPGHELDSPRNPRIVASGPWLNAFDIDPRAGTTVESPAAARELVAELAAAEVDFIKVYLHLSREIFEAILDEAEVHDLPVAGHVPLEIDSLEAPNLGLTSIEHLRSEVGGFCAELSDDACQTLLSRFRESRIRHTATLLVNRNRAYFDRPETFEELGLEYAPTYLVEEWEAVRQERLENEDFDVLRERWADEKERTGILYRARLPLLLGTDAGDIFCVAGFSLHDELALLVEAGISPLDALRSATNAPIEFLGRANDLGSLETGKLADIVLLEGNPLEDIHNTRRIRAVVRDGLLYDREALDAILKRLESRGVARTGLQRQR